MATKTIKALVNGVVQNIEVEEMTSPEQPLSYDERLDTLEDKHEVVYTDGNILVGNGTTELKEMTPEETLEHINGSTILMMPNAEIEAIEEKDARTLYIPIDAEDNYAYIDIEDNSVDVETGLTLNEVNDKVSRLEEQIADQNSRIEQAIENEKGSIVDLLIDELQGIPVFGVVDENNNITVTSLLPNGTYTLKYENEDGTTEEIGTITVSGGAVVIVNLLPDALTPNDITTVFDGVGYKNGQYASAASPYYNTDAAFFCTGLMPIPASKTFYIKGCTIDTSLSHTRFGLMKEDGSLINTAVIGNWNNTFTVTELGTQYYSITIDTSNSTLGANVPYYFYFSASGTGENVIVSATPIE